MQHDFSGLFSTSYVTLIIGYELKPVAKTINIFRSRVITLLENKAI